VVVSNFHTTTSNQIGIITIIVITPYFSMVQSINTKALVTLASVLRRPTLLIPHVFVPTISHLNYTALKEYAGITAVVFDKDNTLTAPYGLTIHPNAVQGLQAAKDVFGVENVAILSNSAGTLDDPNYEDALKIEDALGIAVIRHDEKKPGGLQEVLAHFGLSNSSSGDDDDNNSDNNVSSDGITNAASAAAARICMVGDRLLTDIVFGNLNGMLCVHTLPLCTREENRDDNTVASIIRSIENTGLYGKLWFGRSSLYDWKKPPPHKYWKGEVAHPLILPPHTGISE
jgi:phosphatidylglycerophosphatase GEP4